LSALNLVRGIGFGSLDEQTTADCVGSSFLTTFASVERPLDFQTLESRQSLGISVGSFGQRIDINNRSTHKVMLLKLPYFGNKSVHKDYYQDKGLR
jgi:hypothetical protein